jgi:hypothetical protein
VARPLEADQVQAVIINAGGIVAYYPSKFPLHHRAEFLGERDLFGELTKAAHDDGLYVMARMDSNRTADCTSARSLASPPGSRRRTVRPQNLCVANC